VNLLTRLLRREPEIARYNVGQYIEDLSQAYGGYRYLGSPGWTKTEDIETSFTGYINGLYKSNGIVFAIVLARMLLFTEARFCWFEISDNGENGRPKGRDGLELLENPWPNCGTGELLARMEQDVSLGGNFYAVREGSRLRRLRPDWVTIVLTAPPAESTYADVAGYWYHPGRSYTSAGEPSPGDEVYLPDECCHWSPLPDPDAQYRGMSWLTPAVKEVQADKAASDHKLAFFTNGATLGVIISAKESLTNQQYKEWKANFEGIHSGAGNAYKSLFLASPVDTSVLTANMQQLDFKVVQGAGETRLCALGGVPPIIVGLSEGLASATYSNYGMARRKFGDHWGHPQWRSAAQALSSLVDPPSADVRLGVNTKGIAFLREDAKDLAEIEQIKASTLSTLIMAGYEPDSCVAAVEAEDLSLLKHTGLTSVQLVPPGSDPALVAEEEAADAEEYDVLLEEFRADLADGDEIQRDRYDVRNPRGSVGGGRFRKLSDAIVALLGDWNGDGDPLDGWTQPQLKKAAEQLGIEVPPRSSKPKLKSAILAHARGDRGRTDGPAKKAAPKALEPAGTVRAEGYSTAANTQLRVVADGKGGYVGQRQQRSDGSWRDDPSLGTGNTPKDITDRMPRGQWRMVRPKAPAKKATPRAPAKKAEQPNFATVRRQLLELETNEERREYLDSLGPLTQAQANKLAKDLGARQTRISADRTLDNIVEHFDTSPDTRHRMADERDQFEGSTLADTEIPAKPDSVTLARQRQADIDTARGFSDAAAQLDELLANEASTAALLSRLDNAGKRDGIAEDLAPVRAAVEEARQVEVENRVRAAFRSLLGRPGLEEGSTEFAMSPGMTPQRLMREGGYVSIADLRDELADIPRAEQDAALKRIAIHDPGSNAVPESAQASLTARQRAGALRYGDQDKHWLIIDDPSPHPVPDARAEMARILSTWGITQDGKAGDTARFTRGVHQPIDGDLREGQAVQVVRPGHTLTRDGEQIRLSKAVVEAADNPSAGHIADSKVLQNPDSLGSFGPSQLTPEQKAARDAAAATRIADTIDLIDFEAMSPTTFRERERRRAAGGRVQGRNRLAQIRADAASIRSTDSRADTFDTEMAEIGHRQGFDAKPRVASESEVDAAVAGGWVEIWRGIKDGRGGSAAEIAERLRTGDYEPGKSSGYGAGIYTSVDRHVAEAYRGADITFDRDHKPTGASGGAEGGLVRMALDPSARVADYDESVEQWRAAQVDMTPDEKAVLGDLGRYLAAQGFDAIRVRGHGDGFSISDPPDQYVILNRSALMVQADGGDAPTDPEALRDSLDLKTVPELKDMIRERNKNGAKLRLSGRKRELVDRLVEHDRGGGTPDARALDLGEAATGVRPSGLPTDRKPESGDFDDLAERISLIPRREKTEERVLEILRDLNKTELRRLARKFPGQVTMHVGDNMSVSSTERGLQIPAGMSLDEARRWLAQQLTSQRWFWRSEEPDPDDIARSDYEDGPDEDDPGEPDDEQRARASARMDEIGDEDEDEPEDEYDAYRAAGMDTNLGGERLHLWWTKGPGLKRWVGSPHPWTTLYRQLLEKVGSSGKAKRMASKWFIEVFGYAAGSDKHRVASGKPPRGDRIGPG
jgi:phage portal protein BeeE